MVETNRSHSPAWETCSSPETGRGSTVSGQVVSRVGQPVMFSKFRLFIVRENLYKKYGCVENYGS